MKPEPATQLGRPSAVRRWGPIGAIGIVAAVIATVAIVSNRGDNGEGNGTTDATSLTTSLVTTVDSGGTAAPTTVAGSEPSSSTTTTTLPLTPRQQLVIDGPMTPEKAALLGATVDFGPGCDTTTGRIAIPSAYAPPCVEPFSGDNGGATATGVTADTIKIVRYETDIAFTAQSGGLNDQAGVDNDAETGFRTAEGFFELYSKYFELYGRKVELVRFISTGPPEDAERAKADAIAIAEMDPFAVIGGPAQTAAFGQELIARHVLCVGGCALSPADKDLESYAPYSVPLAMSSSQYSMLTAEFVIKALAGRPAAFAGDELSGKKRVFGSLHYEVQGEPSDSFDAFKAALSDGGVELASDVPYFLDLAVMQETARTAVTKLRDAGVTTVILATDPYAPFFVTQEATAQGWFPEWVIGPNVSVDLNLAARQYDQQQWAHAFGLSQLAVRTTEEARLPFDLYRWYFGIKPPNNAAGAIALDIGLLFTGIHMAGPNLTAESFNDGLFRMPSSGGTSISPTVARGVTGLWPELGADYLDRFGTDDVTVIFWDPTVEGEDELGAVGTGMYRFADAGARYKQGEMPNGPGLFDNNNSVAIFTEVPADAAPPTYPSPA